MISYHRILMEMENQLNAAKQTTDEQAIREALSAIRSLCEVALPAKTTRHYSAVTVNEPKPIQTISPSIPTKKVKDDDANGDSIFDF